MKNAFLSILAAGLFTASYAQENSLLFEVTGKDLPQPSYLYGTFHLVCPPDLRWSDATLKAMSASRQLYLELDMDDPSLQPSMVKGMMFLDGKSIRDFVKPEDFAVLDAYFKQNFGAGLSLLGTAKPIALLAMMYSGLMKCQPASYDMALAEIAAKEKKEIRGLESVETQLAVLDRIPFEQQVQGLVDIARRPEVAQKEFTALLNAYKSQDVGLLMKLMEQSEFDSETQGFEEELLDKRNESWIPVIETAAREKPTFFAFGAGHLGGPKGVIALLKARGYTVRPLR
jgi:uncharacterized protein YbaP (TraB family)